jgi:hypothetical protein
MHRARDKESLGRSVQLEKKLNDKKAEYEYYGDVRLPGMACRSGEAASSAWRNSEAAAAAPPLAGDFTTPTSRSAM